MSLPHAGLGECWCGESHSRMGAILADLADQRPATAKPAFTCPRCGKVSHNPNDLREGYCGACHDWTGKP